MKKIDKKILIAILIGIVTLAIFIILVLNNTKKNTKDSKDIIQNNNEKIKEEKKLKILDLNSNSRPYAIMINNLAPARPYQSGLQDAYIVYEMIVEGGITRMMALFKDKNISRIGPVRSSRHYYLDYALENDAIYVHYGWSPQAKSDIRTLGVNNINGLYDAPFWRENLPIAYEHTAFTSIEKLEGTAKNKGYRLTSDNRPVLDYSIDEIKLDDHEDKKAATEIDIRYSNYITTNYKYNEEDKLYYRSANGKEHVDYVTKKQYTTKNIIIAYVSNEYIANDNKGRQTLNNIGTGNGYYITNGVAVPITWEKTGRKNKTIYKYKNGDELRVNDGNTFIQIAPINSATIK